MAIDTGLSLAGVVCYTLGALLYLAGGCLSEAGSSAAGAWLWVVGSAWFVTGAFLLLQAAAAERHIGGAHTDTKAGLLAPTF